MAQEAPAPEGEKPAAENDAKPEGTEKPQDGPQTFDAEYVKTLRAESAKWRIEAQQAREKAEEYENQNKSELEKAQTKATKLEQAKADAESKLLRFEVATEKQVPKELVSRLRGSTREELEADAEELLSLVKSRNENNEPPDFDGGVREPAPESQTPEVQHNNSVLKLLGLAQ